MKSNLSKKNCLHFCQLADQYDLSEELKQDCVVMNKRFPLSTIEKSPHFAQMSTTSSTLNNQILIEKIKVLEEYKKLLDRYYSTCCDLVKSIYCYAANMTFLTFFECYSSEHPSKQNFKFVYDCRRCKRMLRENKWPKSIPFEEVKTEFEILCRLASNYEQVFKKGQVVT